jgi:hypothetical protein
MFTSVLIFGPNMLRSMTIFTGGESRKNGEEDEEAEEARPRTGAFPIYKILPEPAPCQHGWHVGRQVGEPVWTRVAVRDKFL